MSGSLETRCGTWCFDPVKNQLSSERSSLHGNGGSNQLPGPGQGLGGVWDGEQESGRGGDGD